MWGRTFFFMNATCSSCLSLVKSNAGCAASGGAASTATASIAASAAAGAEPEPEPAAAEPEPAAGLSSDFDPHAIRNARRRAIRDMGAAYIIALIRYARARRTRAVR